VSEDVIENSGEQVILVGGVPVPLEMAGKAVARCIRAIQIIDGMINQGFASAEDLKQVRAGLTGEDELTDGTKDVPV
jgi:hypothetical protein